jgi:hypothetical protein
MLWEGKSDLVLLKAEGQLAYNKQMHENKHLERM